MYVLYIVDIPTDFDNSQTVRFLEINLKTTHALIIEVKASV